MKRIAVVLLTGLLCFGVYGQVDTSKQHFWMMTYFINGNDYDGARLAFSSDTTGNHWQKYNNEAAVLVPTANVTGANDHRMRDPMIAYDSIHGKFNMVWTVSWTGTVIGWDTSSLLKSGTWGPQQGLAVGASSNAAFSWAPEIFWDDLQSKWMLYWSCSISGSNTRLLYSIVPGTDFTKFGTPATLLNTGYDIIDADMIKVGAGNYQMFFKDERANYKYIRRASGATTPEGTYGTISSAVSTSPREGPTSFKQGNEYHVILDHYSNQGFQIIRSTNIDTALSPWPENPVYYGTGTTAFVGSHCNVIAVPKKYVLWMLYNIPLPVVGVKFMPAIMPKTELYGSDIKVFDLSGRMVAIERVLNSNGTPSKSIIGRMPAGVYIKTAGKENSTELNIAPQK